MRICQSIDRAVPVLSRLVPFSIVLGSPEFSWPVFHQAAFPGCFFNGLLITDRALQSRVLQ